jgi:hypothetical protein
MISTGRPINRGIHVHKPTKGDPFSQVAYFSTVGSLGESSIQLHAKVFDSLVHERLKRHYTPLGVVLDDWALDAGMLSMVCLAE